MAADTLKSVKNPLINFAITELSKPASNHIYHLMKSEMGSLRHSVLVSLLSASLEECPPTKNHDQSSENIVEDQTHANVFKKGEITYESILNGQDSLFKHHFRLDRRTVLSLVQVLGKRLRYGNKSVSPSVPLEEKLLMTCWMLGNTSSYREASKIFKVSKAVVHHIFHHICNELALLAEKYIRWPTQEECATITDSFENQFGFPGVVGVIGSCSIRVREPPGNSGNDINGIVLQAVCDDKMLLLDVYTGYPGDTTPAKVLPKSPLYDRLASKNDPLIEPHKHILGNSNYPQLATLLTPYNEDGNQTHSEQELKFNRLHKMACSLIDDSFEILKKRFRRLEYIDVTRVNVANKVIVAACVLHNFAILQGDYYSPLMESPGEVSGSGDIVSCAAHKRNAIAKFLGQSLVPGGLKIYSARTQRIFPQHGAVHIDDRDSCFHDRPHALLVISLYSGRAQHRPCIRAKGY
uniref:DDE Tnp4 domain-containing protein n=1 Tax=Timema shepardi TaxID=629360 RepID=A0A7R9AQ24_TIMSH|nr:unnamed protein product [Timema shepardi]